ncbi:MAG: zinc ribbon domain-containing protein [Clostridiales bacterium]|nr:zinc ribbon domain-containing protein [Clostridiales bacterium]MCF8021256.1 zinc ribbon domain-containing protein [Clostridiales bacterium]
MEMNQSALNSTEVFKLAPGDIDHLFRHSGLTGNNLSPFYHKTEQAAVSSPSQAFRQLSESPGLFQVAKKLLEPDLKIIFQRGGAGTADDNYYALLSGDDKAVLGQFINTQGELLLLMFPDWDAFLKWWVSIYASEGTGDYRAVFPDILEIEILVCAMHCIDLYRRSYMKSMLDYRSLGDISVTTQDFMQLLKRTLASADKRWLLPALFELTPGLKNNRIKLHPEHLKKLEELGFVDINKQNITMAEQTTFMGEEFLQTWMGAVGCGASAMINGEERNLSRVFLAPTAFANHLFSFETRAGGEHRFRHQAATGSELKNTLGKWMKSLRKVTGGAAAAPTTAAGQQPNFCDQCGNLNRPGKKFCTCCGAPI